MKDEIKEILDRLKIKSDRYNHHLKYNMSYENKDEDYEAHLLLDYITNLQEENKKISIQHLATVNKLIETQQENDKLKEIKNKAIKYIKKEIADIEFMKKEYSDYDKIGEIEVKLKSIEELNDILNGGNE